MLSRFTQHRYTIVRGAEFASEKPRDNFPQKTKQPLLIFFFFNDKQAKHSISTEAQYCSKYEVTDMFISCIQRCLVISKIYTDKWEEKVNKTVKKKINAT